MSPSASCSTACWTRSPQWVLRICKCSFLVRAGGKAIELHKTNVNRYTISLHSKQVGKAEVLDLAARLTEDLQETRYSAAQALMHPFLANVVEQQPTEEKGAHGSQLLVNSSTTIEGQSEIQSKAVDDTAGQREDMRERMEVWMDAKGSSLYSFRCYRFVPDHNVGATSHPYEKYSK